MGRQNKYLRVQKHLVVSLAVVAVLVLLLIAVGVSRDNSNMNNIYDASQFASLQSDLFPTEGFKTEIILGDTIPRLVESGAIDMDKIRQIYDNKLTDYQTKILTESSNEQLTLTPENANFLLIVFWSLGISNKNSILEETAKYDGVANLASTGGWILGKQDAMTYFNKLDLIKLTPEQQANFEEVAKNTYRPCCNNPTAFPDCNHGAALLALLELGASQGLSKDELYTLALQANTLWFPQQYLSTAVYLRTKNIDYWSSARDIVGYDYSSVTGWMSNVYKPLQSSNLLPQTEGGGSCGI